MNQASMKYMFYMTRYAAQDKGVDPEDRNTSLHNLLAKIAFNVYCMFLESLCHSLMGSVSKIFEESSLMVTTKHGELTFDGMIT